MNKDIKSHYLLAAAGACILLAVGVAYVLAPHALKPATQEDTIVVGAPKTDNSDSSDNSNKQKPIAPTPPPDSKLCAEVITRAQDPSTKKAQEFPTPCDVPVGWRIIKSK